MAKGINFTDAFVTNSLCCPSRASTLTGQYSSTNGVWRNSSLNGGFFTAENGKSVRVFSASQVTGLDEPIVNPDGTLTFVATAKGLPEKLSIPTVQRSLETQES